MSKGARLLIMLALVAMMPLAGCGLDLRPLFGGGQSGAPPSGPEPAATRRASGGGAAVGTAGVSIWISLVPPMAQAGDEVVLMGQGFAPEEEITLAILRSDGQVLVPGFNIYQADGLGNLPTTRLRMPSNLTAGEYLLEARGGVSQRAVQFRFWVRGNAGSVELTRTSGAPGDRFSLTAAGFAPGERVVVFFEGHGNDPLTALSADVEGSVWADNLRIPFVQPGDYDLILLGQLSQVRSAKSFRVSAFQPVLILNAETLSPNAAVSVFGYGFAPSEEVDVYLDGQNAKPVALQTDSAGHLAYHNALKLPNVLMTKNTVVARGKRSQQEARTDFQYGPGLPSVELSDYFGSPGARLTLAGQGFRSRERVEVFLGDPGAGKKLLSVRADDNGNLSPGETFNLPEDLPVGSVRLSVVGEVNRGALTLRFDILPWAPEVVLSPASGLPGTAVYFDCHGFAAKEEVRVYLGDPSSQPITSVTTDGQGSLSRAGPLRIPDGARGRLSFYFVGGRSGAKTQAGFSVNASHS